MSVAWLMLWGCSGKPPSSFDAAILAPCPSSPNCVSSLAEDDRHRIEPLRLSGSSEAFWTRLQTVIGEMPRTELKHETPRTRHYVFTTAMWRFNDDVQFEMHEDEGVVHIRSASRVGKSDLGANRRRMEAIRSALKP